MDYDPLRSHGFRCLRATEVDHEGARLTIAADYFLENLVRPGMGEEERAALRFYTVRSVDGAVRNLSEREVIQLLGQERFNRLPDGLTRESARKPGWKY